MDSNEEKLCVKCGEGQRDGDLLNQVGRYWSKERGTPNPLNTLIDQATKNNLKSLASTLQSNKENGKATFIHQSCRTELKNQARTTKRGSLSGAQSSSNKRRF